MEDHHSISPPGNKLASIEEYHMIGFDVDHCLVRYKYKPFLQISCKSMSELLISEKGYKPEDFKKWEENISFGMKNLIIDMKSGFVLKLGPNKRILRGYKGFTRLTKEELEKHYGVGDNCVLEKYEERMFYKLNSLFLAGSAFEIPIVLLFTCVVDHREQEGAEPVQYEKIIDDLIWALRRGYVHYNEKKVTKPLEWDSIIFKTIFADKAKYIVKQDEFRDALRALKKAGKVLFITTNSHIDNVDTTMGFAYGEDWKEIFDFIIVDGAKPGFFHGQHPMVRCDFEKPNYRGETVSSLEDEKGKVFISGNCWLLKDFAMKKHNTEELKTLFVGDNYITDCFHSKKSGFSDSLCLVEEIYDVRGLKDKVEMYDYEAWWGKYFEDELDGKPCRTMIPKQIENFANAVFPGVDSEEALNFFALKGKDSPTPAHTNGTNKD